MLNILINLSFRHSSNLTIDIQVKKKKQKNLINVKKNIIHFLAKMLEIRKT